MNLKASQWLVIVILDLLLRYGYFATFGRVAGLVPALCYSAGHLTLLFVVNNAVRRLRPRASAATVIVLTVTNVLLAAAYVFIFVFFMGMGGQAHVASCIVHSCSLIELAITYIGGWYTLEPTIAQLAISLAPVLLVLMLAALRADARQDQPREPRPLVPLRAWQWILIFALDLVITGMRYFPYSVMAPSLVLPGPLIRLALLALVNYAGASLSLDNRLDNRTGVALLLLVTNTLFTVGFVWLGFNREGSFCFTDNDTCYRINGVITPFGIRHLIAQTAIAVAINVVVVLVASALGGNLRKQRGNGNISKPAVRDQLIPSS